MPLARFELSPGCERNPALTEAGCQPREAESLRVSRGRAGVNVGVAVGPTDEALQTESAATRAVERNVAWLADLRRSPSATILRGAVNKKATEVLGGRVTSPDVTLAAALSWLNVAISLLLLCFPRGQYPADLLIGLGASVLPFPSPCQKLVVGRFGMTYVGDYGKVHRVLIEVFCGSRAPDSSAAGETCVFGDEFLPAGRTVWEQLAHPGRESPHVFLVQPCTPRCLTLPAAGPRLVVGQTFSFGKFKGDLRNQQPLPLVPLSGTTPLQHDGAQG